VRTELRDARREGPAPRPPADVPLDPRVALAARVGNQGLQRMLAREAVARPADKQDTLRTIFVSVGKTVEEASALLHSAGPFAVAAFTKAEHFARNPIDKRRANIKGTGYASMLDWDAAHPKITPPNPTRAGAGSVRSLREIFYEHRSKQLLDTFGVDAVDLVIVAAEIGDYVGDPVGTKIGDLLFRCNQYAIVETLNVSASARYESKDGKTFCNVYAYDLVTAMGGYLPRVWWMPPAWRKIEGGAEIVTPEELKRMRQHREKVSNVIAPIYHETVYELNANQLSDWMYATGPSFGWRKAGSMTAAQDAANGGQIVVMVVAQKDRTDGTSGHVSVVLAESKEHQAHRNGTDVVFPLQSMAGGGMANVKYTRSPTPGEKTPGQWWNRADREPGSAWIFEGKMESPLVSPEEMGMTVDT
jgi:hypothetical protein